MKFFNFSIFNIEKLLIKIGLRKRPTVGISMKNCGNVSFRKVRSIGYDKGIEAENVQNWSNEDVEIK